MSGRLFTHLCSGVVWKEVAALKMVDDRQLHFIGLVVGCTFWLLSNLSIDSPFISNLIVALILVSIAVVVVLLSVVLCVYIYIYMVVCGIGDTLP